MYVYHQINHNCIYNVDFEIKSGNVNMAKLLFFFVILSGSCGSYIMSAYIQV